MPEPAVDVNVLLRLLSVERLGSYFEQAHGDTELAFCLYEWNIRASGAVLSLSAMVEVIVRNALDSAMTRWAGERGDWLDLAPLDKRGAADIRAARRRMQRSGREVSHGKVVAELSFGFWRFLVSRRYLTSLWVPGLHRAFPGAAGDARSAQQQVERALEQLLFVRNRAAHHEPIHRRRLDHDVTRSLELLGWIHPEAARWVQARESVSSVMAARPVGPAEVS